MKYLDYNSLSQHPISIWIKKYSHTQQWQEIPDLLKTLDDKHLPDDFRYLLGREITGHIVSLLEVNKNLPKTEIASFLTPFFQKKKIYHFMNSSRMIYELDQIESGRAILLENGIDLSRTHPKHRQYALERTIEKYGNKCSPFEAKFESVLESAQDEISRYCTSKTDWKNIIKKQSSMVLAFVAQTKGYSLSHQDFQATFFHMYQNYYHNTNIFNKIDSDKVFPFNRFIDLLSNSPYFSAHILNSKGLTKIFENNFFSKFDKENKKQQQFKKYAQHFISQSMYVRYLKLQHQMETLYPHEDDCEPVQLKI
jgi:hypothetical protein